jgi:hypothetical protein
MRVCSPNKTASQKAKGRKMIIEKLMQKIENNINLHKRTLIESHYVVHVRKIESKEEMWKM